jgi:hypothetical protein
MLTPFIPLSNRFTYHNQFELMFERGIEFERGRSPLSPQLPFQL